MAPASVWYNTYGSFLDEIMGLDTFLGIFRHKNSTNRLGSRRPRRHEASRYGISRITLAGATDVYIQCGRPILVTKLVHMGLPKVIFQIVRVE